MTYGVGDNLRFAGERVRYTVRAIGKRYVICTKPFNPLHTLLYTIIDLELNIRGRENLIFGLGFETDEDCREALIRLESGETEVSSRYYTILEIEE